MAHLLAKLKNVPFAVIGQILNADAPKHAEEGLYLKHLWKNADDPNEVLFLFRADDLNQAKQFIKKVHTQALKEDPAANLPQMTFLVE